MSWHPLLVLDHRSLTVRSRHARLSNLYSNNGFRLATPLVRVTAPKD